jgi:undecaprenyl-diphosphatase
VSTLIQSIILGIVEGLTEFIPVSSTGHLIVFDHLLHFKQMLTNPDQAELFEVVIQLGAILAVGFLYRARLWSAVVARDGSSFSGKLRWHLILAFLPAAIIGFLFHKKITEYLFSPFVVGLMLILGGIAIIVIESTKKTKQHGTNLHSMTMKDALIVGFSQVLSLIPGVSRSGATIMGGYAGGMTREAATEFSFLLSFPVMIAASGYELIKYRHLLTSEMGMTLAVGFMVAFFSALVVVRWLIGFVRNHSFIGFGIYRIIAGILIMIILGAD